jgi:hypothetical protein
MGRRSDNPTPAALRNRRYRARIKRNEAVGRFVITERLVSKLVRDGEITEAAATTLSEVENSVGRVLARYAEGQCPHGWKADIGEVRES